MELMAILAFGTLCLLTGGLVAACNALEEGR